MMVYLITFFISILLIYFGLKFEKKNPVLYYIFVLIGLTIPCLLAANRSLNIGTDTKGYVSKLFEFATQSESIFEYFKTAKSWYMISDWAYLFLNYIIAHVFNNFRIFLFIIELLIIIPLFKALNSEKKSNNEVLLGFILFYLFEYNVTFNMVRQCIAISFIILMFKEINNNKYFKAYLYILIAIGFHSTAAICLLIPIIKLCLNNLEGKKKKIFKLFIYSLLIVFCIFFKQIVLFISDIGIYSHGALFLKVYSTEFDFSFIDTFTYLIAIILFLSSNNKNYNNDFNKMIGFTSLILLSLGWNIMYMERISYYFYYPFLLYIIPKSDIHNNALLLKKKNAKIIVLVSYFVIYWIVMFSILNAHNTVPYIFA